jgi:ATP-dependent Clp protease adaptor protein ClpS
MSQTHVTTRETVNTTLYKPKKFKVIVLNDDSTPITFVVDLLMVIFGHSADSADAITMQIHNTGKGVAGVYFYEIAEQKTYEAVTVSRNAGFSLNLTIEEE